MIIFFFKSFNVYWTDTNGKPALKRQTFASVDNSEER